MRHRVSGVNRRPTRPTGTITRGTTNPNRLRRVDRFLTGPLAGRLRAAGPKPVAVDLGYGARPFTAIELHERLLRVRPDVRLLGLEIDPARVAAALPHAREDRAFRRGGFELPLPDGWAQPTIVRAFNVLRQYDEDEVADAWAMLTGRLAPGGVLVEGTCDELGRRASWVTLDAAGPRWFTISQRLAGLTRPGEVADRLPKALIHHNVPGEPIHTWLTALDRAWELAAPLSVHGARQRWIAAVGSLRSAGHPVLDSAARWRLGEVTVPWSAVAPLDSPPFSDSR